MRIGIRRLYARTCAAPNGGEHTLARGSFAESDGRRVRRGGRKRMNTRRWVATLGAAAVVGCGKSEQVRTVTVTTAVPAPTPTTTKSTRIGWTAETARIRFRNENECLGDPSTTVDICRA